MNTYTLILTWIVLFKYVYDDFEKYVNFFSHSALEKRNNVLKIEKKNIFT